MLITITLFFLILILHFLGMKGLYYNLFFYDKLLHFLGGIFISLLFCNIYKKIKKRLPKLIEIILIILTVSLVWEMHEYVWDTYLKIKYNLPQMQLGMFDTVGDTLMNISGCLLFYFFIRKRMLKKKKYKKVVIFGTFDIIHPGHISVFKYAKSLAKELYVVIARDQNIDKETKLLFNEKQRLKNLQKYKIIDQVLLGDLKNPLAFHKQINPDLAVLGYDQIQNVDLLKKLPLEVKRAPEFHSKLFKSQKIKKILTDPDANFYLINKESGPASFKIVSILRKTLNMKKIGFAGTLDPLASGLMIMASGKATKFLDAFHFLNKTYQAEIELGKISDTFDAEGNIETKKLKNKITKEQIQEILNKNFTGEILQTPPIFSAKKINGQKAYNLARKNKEVILKPVEINISNIKILKYQYPFLTLEINCSKGTYIRSIAHDLGQKLGTGGILTKLKRTNIGPFNLKYSLPQENINSKNLAKNKLNILDIIRKINNYFLKK
jgi:tRNA pseudouridine55 synthase